jgi:hypothetical protein
VLSALLWIAGGLLALYAFGRWVGHPPALRWIMPGFLLGTLALFALLMWTAIKTTGGE